MPARLRPTAPIAPAAILVGDPGRALALAQELLEAPKMSNHARGLWGYSGTTAAGDELTIQSTGIGGPSAALVLGDLHELGVRRAIRVGTAVGVDRELRAGAAVAVSAARVWRHRLLGDELEVGPPEVPEPELAGALEAALGLAGRSVEVASLEIMPRAGGEPEPDAAVADMQTAPLLRRARELEVAAAAVLIVDVAADGEHLDDEGLREAVGAVGAAATSVLAA